MKALRISNAFVRGYFRAFDLFGTSKSWPDISNPQQRDYEALKGDWDNVGLAIQTATNAFSDEHKAILQ